MAMLSAAASPFCRIAPEGAFCKPEEDPFLLLESTLRAVQEILLRRRGLPLRRTWNEQPYGEEAITLLEEEVIPGGAYRYAPGKGLAVVVDRAT
jgi:hypothetical protein